MPVVRTVADLADALGQLMARELAVRLDDLALAMDPLGLYGVQLRALFQQKTAYDIGDTLTLCFCS
jgi:hypothetical protein